MVACMVASATHEAIKAVWRGESARVVGVLARIVRDVGLAEELAQDALVAALEEWPRTGVPESPGAWLTTAAKHRAIDHFRRTRLAERRHEEIGQEQQRLERDMPDFEGGLDDDIGDDLLRLI